MHPSTSLFPGARHGTLLCLVIAMVYACLFGTSSAFADQKPTPLEPELRALVHELFPKDPEALTQWTSLLEAHPDPEVRWDAVTELEISRWKMETGEADWHEHYDRARKLLTESSECRELLEPIRAPRDPLALRVTLTLGSSKLFPEAEALELLPLLRSLSAERLAYYLDAIDALELRNQNKNSASDPLGDYLTILRDKMRMENALRAETHAELPIEPWSEWTPPTTATERFLDRADQFKWAIQERTEWSIEQKKSYLARIDQAANELIELSQYSPDLDEEETEKTRAISKWQKLEDEIRQKFGRPINLRPRTVYAPHLFEYLDQTYLSWDWSEVISNPQALSGGLRALTFQMYSTAAASPRFRRSLPKVERELQLAQIALMEAIREKSVLKRVEAVLRMDRMLREMFAH